MSGLGGGADDLSAAASKSESNVLDADITDAGAKEPPIKPSAAATAASAVTAASNSESVSVGGGAVAMRMGAIEVSMRPTASTAAASDSGSATFGCGVVNKLVGKRKAPAETLECAAEIAPTKKFDAAAGTKKSDFGNQARGGARC